MKKEPSEEVTQLFDMLDEPTTKRLGGVAKVSVRISYEILHSSFPKNYLYMEYHDETLIFQQVMTKRTILRRIGVAGWESMDVVELKEEEDGGEE